MYLVVAWAGWTVEALALCAVAYTFAAAALAGRPMQSAPLVAKSYPAVTILKPLHGAEPNLKENLLSFFRQDYPAAVQIVFGVQDAADPAILVVKALQIEHPNLDSELVIDPSAHGTNAKVSNLINMLARAKHDVLVQSDSDISAPPTYLRDVTGALAQPGVGAVTCFYTGAALAGPWSRLGAMGINYQFLPNVLFGTSLGLAAPCFGSTIALTRTALGEIGGLEAFAGCLADDYEVGRAVRARGASVALPPFTVTHTCAEGSWPQLWAHELRWARTIRILDPIGHWGSLVTYPLPLALIGAVLTGFGAYGLAVLGLALAARLALKGRIDAIFVTKVGPAWLLAARDVISFGVFIVSLFGGKVSWRGQRFHVSPGGVLSRP